jgi:Raf kinase inhibitor-like YbhB/YbcL family protein
MRISSPAFADNGLIPSKYTCDGDDLIPPLAFDDVPANAASLALVVDDPDAPGGTFDHWLVWNVAPDVRAISEGRAPEGATGRNSARKTSWMGPCPPDREHRYFFKLYALDERLDLGQGSSKAQLQHALRGHILAEAQLIGRYDRPRRK